MYGCFTISGTTYCSKSLAPRLWHQGNRIIYTFTSKRCPFVEHFTVPFPVYFFCKYLEKNKDKND